jgi:hypothetical protein
MVARMIFSFCPTCLILFPVLLVGRRRSSVLADELVQKIISSCCAQWIDRERWGYLQKCYCNFASSTWVLQSPDVKRFLSSARNSLMWLYSSISDVQVVVYN